VVVLFLEPRHWIGKDEQRQVPAAFHPETDPVNIEQEAVRPQGQSGLMRKISPLQGVDRRTLSLYRLLYPRPPKLRDITQPGKVRVT
jgi:hypothetical protein